MQQWDPALMATPIIGTGTNNPGMTQSLTTDYVSNKIYENGSLKRILTSNGYIEQGKYYFYQKDHQGNNRGVWDELGNVVQKTHYYPFGMLFDDSESAYAAGVRPYKYGGKEFDHMHGLDWYDFHARMQDPLLHRFHMVDPMAEKYYSVSPYAYCNNNPVNFKDPTGKSGEAVIDEENKTITVTGNLIMYGSKASAELATTTAQAIQDQWNSAGGKVMIGDVEYNVSFVVNGSYNKDITQADIDANTDIKNNYFQVEETNDRGSSYATIGGNSGMFLTKDLENKTTGSHEWGHLMGLDEGPYNLEGKGQPGIMSQRGATVDAEYAYSGTNKLDPNKRIVTQGNVNDIGLNHYEYKNGKTTIGNFSKNIQIPGMPRMKPFLPLR